MAFEADDYELNEAPEDLELATEPDEPKQPPAVEEHEEEERKEKRRLEPEEYGARVQKRIDREVGKRKAMEDRLGVVQAQLDALLSEREEKARNQVEQAQEQLLREMDEAAEEADMARYNALNKRLLTMRAAPAQQAPAQQAAAPAPAQSSLAPEARAWIDRNGWFREEHEDYQPELADRARRIAGTLSKDYGYDTNDPALYEELDRRLGRGGAKDRDRDRDVAQDREERPVGRFRGGVSADTGNRQSAPVRSDRLTERDLRVMETFGLDRNNPVHRKAYVENRSKR